MLSEVWSVSTLTVLLEDWKKKCVSRSRCSVGSQRRISNKGWHQKGPNREMNVSYVVRGLWNYLNVRAHLSSRYLVKLFDFKLQKYFLHHCPRHSIWPWLNDENPFFCTSVETLMKVPTKTKEKLPIYQLWIERDSFNLNICIC